MCLCGDMRPVFRAHRENLLLTPGKRHAEEKEGDGFASIDRRGSEGSTEDQMGRKSKLGRRI